MRNVINVQTNKNSGIVSNFRKSLMRNKVRNIGAGIFFIAPFLLISGIFILYPIIYSLLISFKDFSFLNPSAAQWVGFENYRKLLYDETFKTAIGNTVKLLVLVVPLQTIIAVVLNMKLKMKTFFRTVFYLPYITSPVAVGAVMVYLFNQNGIVTKFMTYFGLDNVAWYADGRYAFYLIIIIVLWTQIGFYTVMYLSGLQGISEDIYEAARIDGATKLQTFIKITVPLLKPTTFLVLFMGSLATLQIFEQPYVVSTTGGALAGSPGDTTLTLVMFLYTQAFKYFDMGYASAAAFVIFIMIFSITLMQYFFFERKN